MKIIAFAGSNGSTSINRLLTKKAASLIAKHEVEILDLRVYDAPIYKDSIEDRGIPESILALRKKLNTADGFIFSTPEHNGFTPAFLKNILDWLSRIDRKTFSDKPMLFMAASPGARAGKSVRDNLRPLLPRWGANVIAELGVGNFNDKVVNGVWDADLLAELKQNIIHLEHLVSKQASELI